jgi:hypothetical protein
MEFNEDMARTFLKEAFEKYEVIEIAVISDFDLINGDSITICVYNPFKDNGVLFCKNITKGIVNQSMEEIMDFMENRVKNLYGYPLKVSIFNHRLTNKTAFLIKIFVLLQIFKNV